MFSAAFVASGASDCQDAGGGGGADISTEIISRHESMGYKQPDEHRVATSNDTNGATNSQFGVSARNSSSSSEYAESLDGHDEKKSATLSAMLGLNSSSPSSSLGSSPPPGFNVSSPDDVREKLRSAAIAGDALLLEEAVADAEAAGLGHEAAIGRRKLAALAR
jgi:hypothetical protein